MVKKTDETPRVISYLRFSKAKQALGDSTRRQNTMADAWCAKRGLTLDDSLRFADEGLSGFHGKTQSHRPNRAGNLAAMRQILNKVESNEISKGTFLLIENLDRLTRQEMDEALELFLGLVRRGLILVTLDDGKEYLKGMPQMDYMWAIMQLARGHEESLRKSGLLCKAWENKRKNIKDKPLTAALPWWLAKKDNKIIGIPEKVAILHEIFQMAQDGRGQVWIAKQLNERGIVLARPRAKVKEGVKLSVVAKTLANRAVIGEFQPCHGEYIEGKLKRIPDGEPLKGYYPAIIDEKVFYAVQQQRKQRNTMPGGANSQFVNILSGILKTPDAVTMCIVSFSNFSKGATKRDVKRRIYVSSEAINRAKGSEWLSHPHQSLDLAVIHELQYILKKQIMPEAQPEAYRIQALDGEINAKKAKIAELQEAILTTPAAAIVPVIAKLEEAIKALAKEKEAIIGAPTNDILSTDAKLIEKTALALKKDYSALQDNDSRLKLRESIRRLVKNIEAQFNRDRVTNEALVTITLQNDVEHAFLVRSHRYFPWVICIRRRDGTRITGMSVPKDQKHLLEAPQHDMDGFHVLDHPLTFAHREKARDMWTDGYTAREIAEETGIRLERVYSLRPRDD